MRTERIKAATVQLMRQKTKRDKQRRIGPSDMGNICLHCLARKMAGEKDERFSMYLFLGSAVHRYIEWITDAIRFALIPHENELAFEIFGDSRARSEAMMYICTIPGYGDIYGSVDFILEDENCIVDWKTSSMKKIKLYKLHGIPAENRGQMTMYLHGSRLSGYNVESAVLVYIPRDASSEHDIWAYEVEYDAGFAQQLIDRAAQIQQWIDAGRWRELPSHEDCFTCNPRGFIR